MAKLAIAMRDVPIMGAIQGNLRPFDVQPKINKPSCVHTALEVCATNLRDMTDR